MTALSPPPSADLLTNGDLRDSVRTRLYLIRHCDVRNPRQVLYGHLEGFPLSDLGVRQAHALGERFAGSGIRQLCASPLERAQQTAEIIASYLPGAVVTTKPQLTEAKFLRYLQGSPRMQTPLRRPRWWFHLAWPGLLHDDETPQELADRVDGVLRGLLREQPGQGGICVSHGDPIEGFWMRLENKPRHGILRLRCDKGGALALDYQGERLVAHHYIPPPGPHGG